MSCYNANLLPGADMRQLGQQIGAQMARLPFLNFNPSVQPIRNEILAILDNRGKEKWIKYYEIEFLLDTDPTKKKVVLAEIYKNRIDSAKFPSKKVILSKNLDNHYIIWNLFNEEKLDFIIQGRPNLPFDKTYNSQISIKQLLSSDPLSKEAFEKIKKKK